MPFATAQDMLDRVDSRWLCRLVNDDGSICTEAEFLASDRVADCLADAAGLILAYALAEKKYTKEELAALQDDSASLLARMNVDLAAAFLAESRQVPPEDVARTISGYGRTMRLLEMLFEGHVIFDKAGAATAGLAAVQAYRPAESVACARRLFGNIADVHRNRWWELI